MYAIPVDAIRELNEMLSIIEVPVGQDSHFYFRDDFDLHWENLPGGHLQFSYRNNTDADLSNVLLQLTPVESQFCSGDTVFEWPNLAMDFTVPAGRYRIQLVSPQL